MSAYILEIKAVLPGGDGPVGYGIDDLGREFAVVLDRGLAAHLTSALDHGRRPIVAVERGRPIPLATAERGFTKHELVRRDERP